MERRVPKAAYVQMCEEADREMLRAEAAEAEVERLRGAGLDWMRRYEQLTEVGRELLARAEAAEAKVAKVEALADWFESQMNWNEWGIHRQIRAALADAPAEQRAEGGSDHRLSEHGTTDCPVERVRATADDEDGVLICSACGAMVAPRNCDSEAGA